ncbi:MAG: hypothetical protein AAGA48_13785 [Myxococcota bacterium]
MSRWCVLLLGGCLGGGGDSSVSDEVSLRLDGETWTVNSAGACTVDSIKFASAACILTEPVGLPMFSGTLTMADEDAVMDLLESESVTDIPAGGAFLWQISEEDEERIIGGEGDPHCRVDARYLATDVELLGSVDRYRIEFECPQIPWFERPGPNGTSELAGSFEAQVRTLIPAF